MRRALVAIALALLGCGEKPPAVAPIGASPPGEGADVSVSTVATYTFDSLDARPVSSDAHRGRTTVLVVVNTWNLASQAQVRYLVTMAPRDAERVHYAAVFVQPGTERELVEIYRKSLGVTFPVAMAAEGNLPWQVPVLPTTMVFDAEGHVRWKREGLAPSEEIREAMRLAGKR